MSITYSEFLKWTKIFKIVTGVTPPPPSGALLAINNLSDVASVSTSLANLNGLSKAGGTMTGALTLSGAPTLPLHAASKAYVDASVGGAVTLTNDVTGSGTGTIETTIVAGAVTLAKLAPLAAYSFIANATAGITTPTAVPFSSFLQSANNLSDLTNLSVARDNLFPVVQIAANAPLLMNRRYHIDSSSGQIIGTLPLTWSIGDQIEIVGLGSLITGGGWAIVCNAGQTIVSGSVTTTSGGALVTDFPRDCVTLEAISLTRLQVTKVQGKNVRTNGGLYVNMLNYTAPIGVSDGGTGIASVDAGKVLVGSGSTLPLVAKGIAAGAGISVAQDASNITISASQMNIGQTLGVSGATQIDCGISYVTQSATEIVFTLPPTAELGCVFEICGVSVGGWRVNCNVGQVLTLGDQLATSYVASDLPSDYIRVVCVVPDVEFKIVSVQSLQLELI